MPTVKAKAAVKAKVKIDAKVAVKAPVKVKAEAKIAVKTAPKKAVAGAVKELPKETGLKLSVYNLLGKSTETINLPKEIFDTPVNKSLIAQYARVYLANQRRGTLKTKSRGEVNISTRKIYRQKGTGRARHGAASAPIFVGGGVAFGPRQRDFSLKLNQKQKKVALFSVLSAKLKDGEIKVVSGFEKIEPKTKKVVEALNNLALNNKKSKVLLITPKSGKDFENVTKAARNIKGLRISSSNLLNTYEILQSKNILFMKDAIETLKENYFKN